MVTYEELSILPHQHDAILEHCAMCGGYLKWVVHPFNGDEYHFCPKCRVIKFYMERDDKPTITDFTFWSHEI